MYGWGQDFGGFLDLCEKVFFLIQCRGVVSPPGQVFFKKCLLWTITSIFALQDLTKDGKSLIPCHHNHTRKQLDNCQSSTENAATQESVIMLQNNLVKEMTILKVVIISNAIKSALDRSYCRVKLLLILKCMKVFSRIHILNKYYLHTLIFDVSDKTLHYK